MSDRSLSLMFSRQSGRERGRYIKIRHLFANEKSSQATSVETLLGLYRWCVRVCACGEFNGDEMKSTESVGMPMQMPKVPTSL